MEKLGTVEYVTVLRFPSCPSKEELLEIMDRSIRFVGMTTHGEPDIRSFPDENGNGGVGDQIYRALTDSYMIGGTWNELSTSRILLSSCKYYDVLNLTSYLMKLFRARPDIMHHFSF